MTAIELPKGYEPHEVEARWTRHWEENKTFTPDPEGPGEPYAIVIPPPNVTGALHMGHALNLAIQDALCRHFRQRGRKVLWVPGTDHAGIATQNVVERSLAAEGKGRHDLGREAFIERVWEWRQEYGGRILNQIRRLGASVDWTRERFTLDQGLSRAVREVFVRLFHEGLVYKGDYIVNWCNRCHTALADDEVDHAPRSGKLYHIKYPLAKPVGGLDGLVVATTRPETMLGDTAVAVHPEDERFNQAIGSYVCLPLTSRKLVVIGDTYVDRAFGTGCLKVTPAHDMNDWELGRKHDLEILQVIDEDGCMGPAAGEPWVGMSTTECRTRIVEELDKQGLLVKVEEHDHSVGTCYRCKSVVEPLVSTQWFVSVKPLAEAARAAVPADTQIFPDNWTKTYYEWLDNIRDWCVSRQIWWGHRIPAWTCADCGELIVATEDPTACPKCGSASLAQEEDVLDTWFSSALWPFSTLGWPDQTRELATFYPTSVLVTGFDILFFWVARMMMMGIHFQEQVPFHHVYIHALVRDEQGKKMSKSTGNVIDPIDMIDRFGADSLRFTLCALAAMGRDIKLSEDRIEGFRHFVNKLWNASRFTLMRMDPDLGFEPDLQPETMPGLHHQWFFHRLEQAKEDLAAAIPEYRFNDAAMGLYSFIWREFCDWLLEMIKPELTSEDPGTRRRAPTCLLLALRDILILTHPIMPFVTQEIWSRLPQLPGSAPQPDLALAAYPEARPERRNPEAVAAMDFLQQVIVAVRNIRSELGVNPGKTLDVIVHTVSAEQQRILEENAQFIRLLARVEGVEVGPEAKGPRASATAVVLGAQLFVPLAGAIDFDAELARLDKELAKLDKELAAVSKKLANQGFLANAPADVVAKEQEKRQTMADKLEKLLSLKSRLEAARG